MRLTDIEGPRFISWIAYSPLRPEPKTLPSPRSTKISGSFPTFGSKIHKESEGNFPSVPRHSVPGTPRKRIADRGFRIAHPFKTQTERVGHPRISALRLTVKMVPSESSSTKSEKGKNSV